MTTAYYFFTYKQICSHLLIIILIDVITGLIAINKCEAIDIGFVSVERSSVPSRQVDSMVKKDSAGSASRSLPLNEKSFQVNPRTFSGENFGAKFNEVVSAAVSFSTDLQALTCHH